MPMQPPSPSVFIHYFPKNDLEHSLISYSSTTLSDCYDYYVTILRNLIHKQNQTHLNKNLTDYLSYQSFILAHDFKGFDPIVK